MSREDENRLMDLPCQKAKIVNVLIEPRHNKNAFALVKLKCLIAANTAMPSFYLLKMTGLLHESNIF